MTKLLIIAALILLSYCKSNSAGKSTMNAKTNIDFIENFESQEHFNKFFETDLFGTGDTYSLENGNLKITTLANVEDRIKVRTLKDNFGLGSYTWRIYTGERALGDRNSIGAFLYFDDEHEIDFEIGSGSVINSRSLNSV